MKGKYESIGMRINKQSNYDDMIRHKNNTAESVFHRPPYAHCKKGDKAKNGTKTNN